MEEDLTLIAFLPDKTVTVYGVSRASVELPCNTSAISEENYPMLVMWFKDNNLNPFYSYDARKLSQSGGSHWSDLAYSGRVSFILSPGDTASLLTLRQLREEDHGMYR